MRTIQQIDSLRNCVSGWRQSEDRIALVPTMGNLHAGHLSLIKLAQTLATRVVVTIFVNPTQFGPGEDYASYPRTLEDDQLRLAETGVDVVFVPSVDEIYPQGIAESTLVSVPKLSRVLCGEFRPGHFDGVTSVVTRLFNIVQPDAAIFGQKDYQQLVIIRRLQADLHLPIRVVAGPTVRENDHLALSSRNQYLDAEDRARAPQLYAALTDCVTRLRTGERDFKVLEEQGLHHLQNAGFKPDYFAIRNAIDLSAGAASSSQLVVMAAAHLKRARLTDNILVDL